MQHVFVIYTDRATDFFISSTFAASKALLGMNVRARYTPEMLTERKGTLSSIPPQTLFTLMQKVHDPLLQLVSKGTFKKIFIDFLFLAYIV